MEDKEIDAREFYLLHHSQNLQNWLPAGLVSLALLLSQVKFPDELYLLNSHKQNLSNTSFRLRVIPTIGKVMGRTNKQLSDALARPKLSSKQLESSNFLST